MNAPVKTDAPLGMLAELTHRCPLQCPYCSDPLELDRKSSEHDTETWKRVFTEAHELGVLQLHLSVGEPTTRDDLTEIVKPGESGVLFRTSEESHASIGDLRRAQAEAEIRCFE